MGLSYCVGFCAIQGLFLRLYLFLRYYELECISIPHSFYLPVLKTPRKIKFINSKLLLLLLALRHLNDSNRAGHLVAHKPHLPLYSAD